VEASAWWDIFPPGHGLYSALLTHIRGVLMLCCKAVGFLVVS
jgi:hypothetical protein